MAGWVTELWRYPVKSMGGEAVGAAAVGPRGMAGDRAYAVVDVETGRVASAKHPRRWARLLACRASYLDAPLADAPPAPVRIAFPDGREVASDDPHMDDLLSGLLGRRVRLVTVPPDDAMREADRSPPDQLDAGLIRDEPLALASPHGTFFDVAPLHIITTATLDALAARAPESRFDARRFRPNVVVRTDAGVAFPENAWVGKTVEVGEVRLRVIDPAPRCVVTTLAQNDLPADADVLRTVVRANSAASLTLAPGAVFPGVAGVYAQVDAGGVIRPGSAAVIHPA